MVSIEEVLSELSGEDINEQGLPPGFRFHPTDEELITFYLASKVFKGTLSGVDIAEVDLNRSEPWELPEVAKMGEREWYFFSLRDRKYPTGLRTNRATGAGYWKATGKDREVYSASSGNLLGMKKTLVFYKGRAPRGEKTKWVMHEYRLDGDFSCRHTCKEEWVICRIFHKIGEKRGQAFHGQSYSAENASSPTANPLTPLLGKTATTLLDCQSQTFRNTFDQILNQGSDSSTHFFPVNYGFQFHQPSFSPSPPSLAAATAPTSNSSLSLLPSSIFKAIFSHQENYVKEEPAVVQQCKTEANFSYFQLSAGDTNLVLVDEIGLNSYSYENQPLFFDMDCSAMRTYPVAAAAAAAPDGAVAAPASSDASISKPFNRAGFQMLLDLPIKIPAESWSLDVQDLLSMSFL